MKFIKYSIFCLSILVVALALFAPFWQNPFVLDDLSKIVENADLRLPSPLPTLIYDYQTSHSAFRNDPSRPLVYLAYWVCWKIGNGEPWPFHALNTFLHALNAALLGLLTYSLILRIAPSLVAASLYLSSPLLAGTVIYAYGLSDVLSTTLILLLLLLTRRNFKFNTLYIIIVYLLALGTKQSVVMAPALILITDFLLRTKIDVSRLSKIYLPLASLSVLYIGLRYYAFGRLGDLEGRDQLLPAVDYASAQGLMILKYLSLLVAPVHLTLDHRLAPWDYSWLVKMTAWGLVGSGSLFAIWILIQIHSKVARAGAWGWLFFIICLLPTSSVFPTVDLFVERRAFTAACGLFVVCGLLFDVFYSKRKFLSLLLYGGLFAVQGALAVQREQVFQSPETLWQESLNLDPENPRALVNLAIYYSAHRHWEDSLRLLERLTVLQPKIGSNYSKMAYIYGQKDFKGYDEDKSWALYEKSLSLDPENMFAWYNAGLCLEGHVQIAKAETYFEKCVLISPNRALMWISWARAAYKLNHYEAARDRLKKALELEPDNREAADNLRMVEQQISAHAQP